MILECLLSLAVATSQLPANELWSSVYRKPVPFKPVPFEPPRIINMRGVEYRIAIRYAYPVHARWQWLGGYRCDVYQFCSKDKAEQMAADGRPPDAVVRVVASDKEGKFTLP